MKKFDLASPRGTLRKLRLPAMNLPDGPTRHQFLKEAFPEDMPEVPAPLFPVLPAMTMEEHPDSGGDDSASHESDNNELPNLKPLSGSDRRHLAALRFKAGQWDFRKPSKLPVLPSIDPQPPSPNSSSSGTQQPPAASAAPDRSARCHIRLLYVLFAILLLVNVVPIIYTVGALVRDRSFTPTFINTLYSIESGVGVNTGSPNAWLEVCFVKLVCLFMFRILIFLRLLAILMTPLCLVALD